VFSHHSEAPRTENARRAIFVRCGLAGLSF
jgi:hypothetical protein